MEPRTWAATMPAHTGSHAGSGFDRSWFPMYITITSPGNGSGTPDSSM